MPINYEIDMSTITIKNKRGNIVGSYIDYFPTLTVLPEIKQVIFNNPATIVMWKDGTKTIVKTHNEEFDEEKGLAMAYLKKVFGGRNQYIKYIKNANRQEKKEIKSEKQNTKTIDTIDTNNTKKLKTKEANDYIIKIYKIISEQLKIEEPNIDSKSNIIDDLGADSLDMVELCMDFEDEFNIEILDEEIEKLPPIVEDIVNFIINKINQ